jgi:hypothetical protein
MKNQKKKLTFSLASLFKLNYSKLHEKESINEKIMMRYSQKQIPPTFCHLLGKLIRKNSHKV